MLHQAIDEHGEVLALVVGRHDHEHAGRHHSRRPSKRNEEICSDTRPTRKMTTLSRMSSTDELVTCDCVRIVHTAYAAPTRKAATLTGRKIRSGLKIMMTFNRMRK